MIVNDAHCHFFSTGFFEALARQAGTSDADATIARLGWDAPGPPQTLATRWRDELDRYEVQCAALIASVPGDEISVSEAIRLHPDRFAGMFMLDPTVPGAPARVRSAIGELGLTGVCLFPAMHHYSLRDPSVATVVETLAAHPRAVLFVHCGVLSIGVRRKLGLPSAFDVKLGNPLDLLPLALAVPSLPIIIPHFGAGFLRETFMLADLAPNVHVDTSSSNGWIRYHPGLTLTDVFRQALAVLGADRILFGTDSSFFPRGWQEAILQTQVATLAELELSDEDTAKILAGNFERIFGVSLATHQPE